MLTRPMPFAEDVEGYARLLEALTGGPALVVMETTGHYWKNLLPSWSRPSTRWRCSTRCAAGASRSRTCRAPGPSDRRARPRPLRPREAPAPTRLGATATEELKELVRHRDRLKQDFDDRVRQLHRLVDLGFPEFTRYVRALDSQLATAILANYPTAQALAVAAPHRLAKLRYDGRHKVGTELACQLVEAA